MVGAFCRAFLRRDVHTRTRTTIDLLPTLRLCLFLDVLHEWITEHVAFCARLVSGHAALEGLPQHPLALSDSSSRGHATLCHLSTRLWTSVPFLHFDGHEYSHTILRVDIYFCFPWKNTWMRNCWTIACLTSQETPRRFAKAPVTNPSPPCPWWGSFAFLGAVGDTGHLSRHPIPPWAPPCPLRSHLHFPGDG